MCEGVEDSNHTRGSSLPRTGDIVLYRQELLLGFSFLPVRLAGITLPRDRGGQKSRVVRRVEDVEETRGEDYRLRGNGIPICIHWTVWEARVEKNAFVASFLLYVLAAEPIKRGPTSGRAFASRIFVPRVSFPWVRLVWEPPGRCGESVKKKKRKILRGPVSDCPTGLSVVYEAVV